ncbi:FAD-dependent monooxygenase [Rhodoligotrophos defluvii]|uniref:FAD-dependent monooxygenase n=1 Tax=Rhodoligotrophos defluvii TaxID=2561934 RepID=UPI0010C9E2E4|nr:FAD-dependent monooxygenase [Rhodoligotrophos defluvii]
MMREDDPRHDVVVVGTGPAGLTACALLVARGLRPAHVPGTRRAEVDPRTAALMQSSLAILELLGVWPGALIGEAAPLWRLRLIDETGRLVRSPSVTFDARELGDQPFGWNIPNEALSQALQTLIAGQDITVYDDAVVRWLEPRNGYTLAHLSDGRCLSARAIIAADGAGSPCRSSAGIKTYGTVYQQQAIATTFAHSEPHHDCSTERHRRCGPLTTVPLPGNRSSLVWMDSPLEVERLMALDDRAFAAELQQHVGEDLGEIGGIGPRHAFAAKTLIARQFAAKRVFLVGEAGHVLPPIGAQGLNLGVRDAKAAAWQIADALAFGEDPGDEAQLAAYDQARHRDILPRGIGVDLMNRSLLSGLLPAQAARAVALQALSRLGPLRRAIMQQGIGI